jgi:hypothetical protein
MHEDIKKKQEINTPSQGSMGSNDKPKDLSQISGPSIDRQAEQMKLQSMPTGHRPAPATSLAEAKQSCEKDAQQRQQAQEQEAKKQQEQQQKR